MKLKYIVLFLLNLCKADEIPLPSPTPWLKSQNQFYELLPKDAVIAEIGIEEGVNSEQILKICKPNKFYLIDPWDSKNVWDVYAYGQQKISQEEYEKQYQLVCTKFKNDKRIVIVRKYSNQASYDFFDNFFDWVFIDGDRTYEGVLQDLELYWPKIKVGGYLCGHDYGKHKTLNFGVIKAVNEFLVKYNLKFELLTTQDQMESFAIRKIAKS